MLKPIQTAMLIDDEEIDQRQYARIIKKSGLVESYVSFTYADEALDALLRENGPRPDLILLDINMPRMNGFEFLEALAPHAATVSSVVIMMLSTSLDPLDREMALSFEMVKTFINKPLEVEDVQHAAEAVRSHQAARAMGYVANGTS